MQVKLEGIFPTIITYAGKDPHHGETRAMWINMPEEGGSEELYRHEVVHVKQFYLFFVPLVAIVLGAFAALGGTAAAGLFAVGCILYALWTMTPLGVLHREAAAYAESARVRVILGTERAKAIDAVTDKLANSTAYNVKASKEEIRRLIEQRFDDKRLY
jgi:hypothetical protein